MDHEEKDIIPFPQDEDLTDRLKGFGFEAFLRFRVLKGAPRFRLDEVLSRCRLSDLQEVAHGLGILRSSTMRKAELLEVLREALDQLDMEDWLLRMPVESWDDFHFSIQHPLVVVDEGEEMAFMAAPHPEVFIFTFHDRAQQSFYKLIPDEIRSRYAALAYAKRRWIRSVKRLQALTVDYAIALTEIYDFIYIPDLFDVMQHYGERLELEGLDEPKHGDLLNVALKEGSGCVCEAQFCVHPELHERLLEEEGSRDKARKRLLEYQQNRKILPLKLPASKEELLEADEYILPTAALDDLETVLARLGMDEDEVAVLLDAYMHSLPFTQAEVIGEALNQASGMLQRDLSYDEATRLLRLLEKLHNSYRYAQNSGYTPEELEAKASALATKGAEGKAAEQRIRACPWFIWPVKINLHGEQPRTVQPSPGRNSPCPCGSGKKYKHCCGRN